MGPVCERLSSKSSFCSGAVSHLHVSHQWRCGFKSWCLQRVIVHLVCRMQYYIVWCNVMLQWIVLHLATVYTWTINLTHTTVLLANNFNVQILMYCIVYCTHHVHHTDSSCGLQLWCTACQMFFCTWQFCVAWRTLNVWPWWWSFHTPERCLSLKVFAWGFLC